MVKISSSSEDEGQLPTKRLEASISRKMLSKKRPQEQETYVEEDYSLPHSKRRRPQDISGILELEHMIHFALKVQFESFPCFVNFLKDCNPTTDAEGSDFPWWSTTKVLVQMDEEGEVDVYPDSYADLVTPRSFMPEPKVSLDRSSEDTHLEAATISVQ